MTEVRETVPVKPELATLIVVLPVPPAMKLPVEAGLAVME